MSMTTGAFPPTPGSPKKVHCNRARSANSSRGGTHLYSPPPRETSRSRGTKSNDIWPIKGDKRTWVKGNYKKQQTKTETRLAETAQGNRYGWRQRKDHRDYRKTRHFKTYIRPTITEARSVNENHRQSPHPG